MFLRVLKTVIVSGAWSPKTDAIVGSSHLKKGLVSFSSPIELGNDGVLYALTCLVRLMRLINATFFESTKLANLRLCSVYS